jgi:hypothetical protein
MLPGSIGPTSIGIDALQSSAFGARSGNNAHDHDAFHARLRGKRLICGNDTYSPPWGIHTAADVAGGDGLEL